MLLLVTGIFPTASINLCGKTRISRIGSCLPLRDKDFMPVFEQKPRPVRL
jgi:hypothetical protein